MGGCYNINDKYDFYDKVVIGECDTILKLTHGSIVIAKPVDSIIVIDLPSLNIRKFGLGTGNPIHSISGPDKYGNIAYVSTNSSKHFVDGFNIKSLKKENYTEGYGTYWDYLGESFALNRNKGIICYINSCRNIQMYNPQALITLGKLHIYDIHKRKNIAIIENVLDEGLSLIDNGGVIFYSKLKKNGSLMNSSLQKSVLKKWNVCPVVCAYNITTGNETEIAYGYKPIMCDDINELIIMDGGMNGVKTIYKYYSLKDSVETLTNDLDSVYTIFGYMGNGIILYMGSPLLGKYNKKRNTSLGGVIDLNTLRIKKLGTACEKTIIYYFDIHRKASYGYFN